MAIGLVLGPAASGAASDCSCPNPSNNVSRSTQSGPSICIAAQDVHGCDLQSFSVSQVTVPQPGSEARKKDDEETLDRLGNMSRPGGRLLGEEDPKVQLDAALQVPPNAWTNTEFDAVKASILASAEKRLGPDGITDLTEALNLSSDALLKVFTDISYRRRTERLQLGRFAATVSYGCLQVAEPGMTAVIRVPFSAAIRRCDEF